MEDKIEDFINELKKKYNFIPKEKEDPLDDLHNKIDQKFQINKTEEIFKKDPVKNIIEEKIIEDKEVERIKIKPDLKKNEDHVNNPQNQRIPKQNVISKAEAALEAVKWVNTSRNLTFIGILIPMMILFLSMLFLDVIAMGLWAIVSVYLGYILVNATRYRNYLVGTYNLQKKPSIFQRPKKFNFSIQPGFQQPGPGYQQPPPGFNEYPNQSGPRVRRY